MNRALAEILLHSVRGRFVRWLRQLRQPRYLIAFLAGLAYFGFFFGPRMFSSGVRVRGGPWEGGASVALLGEPVALVLALVAALLLTAIWVLSSDKPALPLTEAEIDFLLPAPLTRREVLSFVLLRTQIGLLFGSFLFTLFTGAGSAGSRSLLRWAGVWGVLTLFDLHRRGVQLWKARNGELPPGRARLRRGLAIGAGVALWAVIAACLVRASSAVEEVLVVAEFTDIKRLLDQVLQAVVAGPLDEVLAPLAWLAKAATGSATPGIWVFLVLALVLHWEWVVRSAARFEDATVERARRLRTRGLKTSAYERTSRKRRELEPFPLRGSGAPELALYWKNLLGTSRTPLKLQASRLGGLAALVFSVVFLLSPPAPILFALFGTGAMMAGAFSFFSGLWLRNDLRQDLLHLEILRPWPIPGHRLVAAELLAPATTALQTVGLGLLLAAVGLIGLGAGGHLQGFLGGLASTPAGIAALLATGLVLAVPVIFTSLAIQNVAALGLPSWIPLGPQRRRGTAMTGQHILLFLGHALALALAALPGALLVGAVLFAQTAAGVAFHVLELPLLALLGSLSLWLAVWMLVRMGGALWERLDPSQELLGGGE